jgi:signal transduction histidine kinase
VGFGAAYRSFHRQLRLSEMKSNFVSSVSHELRAPIASVRLMAESLERGKIIEAPKQQEYFRFIGQECRRLSALIENVLDFSRIEQGRKQYEFEPTDLAELTRHTVQLMETYAAERGVKLMLNECRVSSVEWQGPDSQPSTPNPQLSVDGKAIQQALINLIDNALKHSAKGETVTVGLEVGNAMPSTKLQAPSSRETTGTKRPAPGADSWVALWVEDHGAGIPASEQEKIFERFYRLGSELRRETQGVGIGLSIVKHVVEAHGGRVRVRSAVGEGSRFTIELWNAS